VTVNSHPATFNVLPVAVISRLAMFNALPVSVNRSPEVDMVLPVIESYYFNYLCKSSPVEVKGNFAR
jgi:hypothetical protein